MSDYNTAVSSTQPETIRVVGIDPGAEGAIAILNVRTNLVEGIHDYPMLPDGMWGDSREVWAILHAYLNIKLICVEAPTFAQQWSRASILKLGRRSGEAVALARLLAPVTCPAPSPWKAKILTGTKRDKHAAVSWVKSRHPEANLERITPPTHAVSHDRAEAVCLAEYARLSYLGELS